MKKIIIYCSAILVFGCSGDFDDVVNFTEVENPNLGVESIVGVPSTATVWLSGLERQLANVFNETLILAELGSDNYVNTQTFFNQFMDGLDAQITDPDMRDTQRQIQRLRELARFGLEEVGPNDVNYSDDSEAEFNYFEGLSYLISGMYFSSLPESPLGAPITSAGHYQNAIDSFTIALSLVEKPEYYLAIARASYYLGDKASAVTAANSALALDPSFDRTVGFDEANEPSNTFESALYERATFDDLQPSPTLDFLDPKYSFVSAEIDADVHYLKAEEAYLILAEAALSDNDITGARTNLTALLDVVSTREVRSISDAIENRTQVRPSSRPDSSAVVVNGRSGLVLSRTSGNVNIPSVSGTSLTAADVAAMQDDDAGLTLLYRTRQEVFIAEGLRLVDMGVKIVIDENEILLNNNINMGDLGTSPVIPSFISAVVEDLDAITYDPEVGFTATTAIDLSAILVANKNSDEVIPFE